MKKAPLPLDQFSACQVPAARQKTIKGGYLAIRRPRRTLGTAIWDDLDIRHPSPRTEAGNNLTLSFWRRK